MSYRVERALERDHDGLVEVMKKFKHTRSFSSNWFSGPGAYAKGWIYKVVDSSGTIIGGFCKREYVRQPVSKLLFFAVAEEYQGKGVAQTLLDEFVHSCEHDRVVLDVAGDNPRAKAFYAKAGFVVDGPSSVGELMVLRKVLAA